MTELKPCPCCGARAVREKTVINGCWLFRVACTSGLCGIHTDWVAKSMSADTIWNRRCGGNAEPTPEFKSIRQPTDPKATKVYLTVWRSPVSQQIKGELYEDEPTARMMAEAYGSTYGVKVAVREDEVVVP